MTNDQEINDARLHSCEIRIALVLSRTERDQKRRCLQIRVLARSITAAVLLIRGQGEDSPAVESLQRPTQQGYASCPDANWRRLEEAARFSPPLRFGVSRGAPLDSRTELMR